MEKWIVLCTMILLPVIIYEVKHRDRHRHVGSAHEHRHGIRHKHGALISIDYFAYSSKIRQWNATLKVILSILTIILCILLNNVYVSIVVIFSMAYLVIKVGGLGFHDYLSILTVPLAFILLSILAIVVDFSGQPVGEYRLYFGLGYLYTTKAMLKGGVFLMLKIIAAISALQLMILTTPSSEIISVMRKTRLPNDFIDLMNMIYRYIFILLDVFARMKNAAESRLGYRDFRTSCYTFGNGASNMLVLSLKKADAYYDAMEARCYDGELRFLEEDKKAEIKLIILATVYIMYLLLLWYLTR
ncbi:cobalt ECF transporter T component CbiQ [Acetivibrio cellulolyticus]|uniref:cobalt ECF transporter T component CbiQ n=1 Tax=Acetivibrio cellulolyticus TaxID=35830 RepID=UPI0001E2CC0E|nr:cobalt ECF transporter T component CbiQ [Acetivibrio cellulolyticus]